MPDVSQHESIFKAFDDDEHLIYGEVYVPLRPDSDGDIMDADTIKKMAHDFLKAKKLDQVDVQHDNNLNEGASIVESFIARKGDPIFLEGAWVVGMHIPDNQTWAKIKKGEINGFSIEALVTKTPQELELEIPPVINGKTTKAEDDHDHEFFVTFDATGKFMGGRTAITKGHFHTIRAGTATDTEQGHNHRFSFIEGFQNPLQEGIIKADGVEATIDLANPDLKPVAKGACGCGGKGCEKCCKGAECKGCADCVDKKEAKKEAKKEETVTEVAPIAEVVEKGGVGSGRRNKNAATGSWVVHDDHTGEVHSVHPTYGKAMNHMDKLNNDHFNDPNTKPGLGGLTEGRYGAMVKSKWDEMHPS